MKISAFLKTLLTGSLLSLCLFVNTVDAGHRVHVHRRPVVIHKGHIHSVHCGHYFHRNNWYFIKGHVHGRHCGHVHVNGVWVVR